MLEVGVEDGLQKVVVDEPDDGERPDGVQPDQLGEAGLQLADLLEEVLQQLPLLLWPVVGGGQRHHQARQVLRGQGGPRIQLCLVPDMIS